MLLKTDVCVTISTHIFIKTSEISSIRSGLPSHRRVASSNIKPRPFSVYCLLQYGAKKSIASLLENTSQNPSEPARINAKLGRIFNFKYSGWLIMPSSVDRCMPSERVMNVPGYFSPFFHILSGPTLMLFSSRNCSSTAPFSRILLFSSNLSRV